MHRTHQNVFSVYFAVALTCICMLLLGCDQANKHNHDSKPATTEGFQGEYPIRVLCTIGQITEMLERIGGEHMKVEGLMGPGVDPHLFRPLASDVDKLLNADVIFYNGLHLEGRMSDKLVQFARQKPTYAVTEGLQADEDKRLREPPEFEGMYDPHVWHDVSLWADCVKYVADTLAKFDPSHAEEYQKNAATYVAELQELHEFCKEEIAKIPEESRVLVTAHDAFGYFGAAYGIEVAGLKGISSDEEIDLAHQKEVQEMLIERKIPAVFVESAINPRNVQSLIESCQAAGWDVVNGGELYADALGPADSDASTYTGMIRSNAKTIVEALSK